MIRRLAILLLLLGTPGMGAAEGNRDGQLGAIGKVTKRAQQFRELQVTDAEEQQLGTRVSGMVRARYGVVQDPRVHRYVTLVGRTVAAAAGKADAPWTFIVLDTDAVNAFAVPGGFVHITRGALALTQDEAELAGVLGHEIIHVTERHSIKSMQKSKGIQMGADETLSGSAALLNQVVEQLYLDIVDKGFGRSEEHESDEKGAAAANKAGYAPLGLHRFLDRLQARNKDSAEKRGLFASHPETNDRLERLTRQVTSKKLTAAVTLADRYRQHISYKPVAISSIAVVAPGASGLASGSSKAAAPGASGKTAEGKPAETKEEPKKRAFGVGRLLPTGGDEKKSTQASASGGPRLIDPERDARGGGNPAAVTVAVTAAELTAFKKEGGLT